MDDLRADLEAAFREASGEPPVEAAPAEPDITAPAAADQNQEAPAGAPMRDGQGRFAKAADGQQIPETGAPAASEPSVVETIRAPASLPAALKAKFAELPQEWRDAFLKRDEDVNAAKTQWDTKAQRLNRFDEIFAPRREKLQLAGLDEFQAVQSLLAAQDLLERDPVAGLQYLARTYGADLSTLAAQAVGQQPAVAPLLDPTHPLVAQLNTLQRRLDAREQGDEQQQLALATNDIAAFKADPKNLYFDNVREQMVALLKAGQASSLADAYETACWMSPEVRPLLQQEAAAKAQSAQQQAAEAQRAAKAQRAAGSVVGAPGAAQAPAAGGSTGSVREDLEAAWEQAV